MDQYLLDEESFEALDRAGVAWRDLQSALYSDHPRIRRPVGTEGLLLVIRTDTGYWLVIGFVEQRDGAWLLTEARHVSEAETAALDQMFRGGSR